MGMAASQARLLTITARIHDVEYQAQSIQNAKVQLATQSDQVYQDYLEALDATTLTITDINKNIITATFNNLCGKNPVDSAYTYALQSSKGALIVPDEIKDGYDKFKQDFPNSNDPYTFALYMMGDYGQEIDWDELEQVWGEKTDIMTLATKIKKNMMKSKHNTDTNYTTMTMRSKFILRLLMYLQVTY